MGGQLKISTINALRIFNQAFGLIFRRSEDHLHLIPTNEGEGGKWRHRFIKTILYKLKIRVGVHR